MEAVKPNLPDVIDQFADYYQKPGNGVWGSLHIVLEDANFGDHSVQFCRELAEREGDDDGVRLADILLTLSKTQRAKLTREVDKVIAERNAALPKM